MSRLQRRRSRALPFSVWLLRVLPLLLFRPRIMRLEERKKQKLNNKTGWLLHDVGRPKTVGRPPNQRRCALEKLTTSSTINLAFQILPPPHDRRQLAKMKLQRQFPSCRLGEKIERFHGEAGVGPSAATAPSFVQACLGEGPPLGSSPGRAVGINNSLNQPLFNHPDLPHHHGDHQQHPNDNDVANLEDVDVAEAFVQIDNDNAIDGNPPLEHQDLNIFEDDPLPMHNRKPRTRPRKKTKDGTGEKKRKDENDRANKKHSPSNKKRSRRKHVRRINQTSPEPLGNHHTERVNDDSEEFIIENILHHRHNRSTDSIEVLVEWEG